MARGMEGTGGGKAATALEWEGQGEPESQVALVTLPNACFSTLADPGIARGAVETPDAQASAQRLLPTWPGVGWALS